MRVLLCHNHYQDEGGESAAVGRQVELLRSAMHSVEQLTRHNDEIRSLDAFGKVKIAFGAIHSRSTADAVREAVRRFRPQIAHIHNVFPLLSPSLYRTFRRLGVPTVQTIHNYRFLCSNGLFFTRGKVCERCRNGSMIHGVMRACYRASRLQTAVLATAIGVARRGDLQRIDRFLALNRFTAEKLVQGGVARRESIRVLGNFLPDPLPDVATTTPGPDGYVLFLGRLTIEKGVHLLLDALSQAPEVRCRIAGYGPEAEAVKDRISREQLFNVTFLGRVSGFSKWTLLREAALLVIPSLWYEAQPLTALESLASGVPVVGPAHGGFPELLQQEDTGVLFRPGDAFDLARTLREVLRDTDRRSRLARRGRGLVERDHSSTSHYDRLISVYEELAIEGVSTAT